MSAWLPSKMFWIVLLRLFSFKFCHILLTVGFINEDNYCHSQRIGQLIKGKLSKGIFKVDWLINVAANTQMSPNWLAHNKKMTEKSVFREAWSPELTSQSFPVSCFWPPGFVPHRKWNLTLLAHQNTGKENRYRKIFLLYLSVHWGDLIEQIKKICHIHFKGPLSR